LSREENWRTRRKTLAARREPTTNSTHVWHRAGIEPAYVGGGERFHHCIPASLGLKAKGEFKLIMDTGSPRARGNFVEQPN